MVKNRKQIEGRVSRPVADTPEQARIDCRLQSYDYTPGVFRKYFTSPYQQYAQHVGRPFTVVKRQPDAEGPDEGTTADDMYLIRFEGDALEITAWGHEVCQLIRANCS
jgi:hypothetical protein